jgi:hypothetical protein
MKKPIGIMIINPHGVEYQDHGKIKRLKYGDMIQVKKKGFMNDIQVFFYNEGYIEYKDTTLIGYIEKIVEKSELQNCHLCLGKDINSTFIHGNSGHSFCCYECAIKFTGQYCPICRLPIDQIILNYIQK